MVHGTTFRAFHLDALAGEQRLAGRAYLEFLRVPDLSLGLYRIPAGGVDAQRPHAEDEAYHVLAGRARFRSGKEEVAVSAGSVLYVAKGEDHRFFDVTEDLLVLVLFAPAESSPTPPP